MKYDQRGVSASKSEVHAAIKHLDKGLYANAFCKILPDISGGDERYCNLLHADTAGTKTSLAYLYWRETGDLSVWAGIAQDAIVMNLDDMACVGCVDDIILSNTIGRNKNLVPGTVVEAIIKGTSDFIAQMRDWGVHLHLAGGETADVGDIVRTVDVGFTAFARMPRANVRVANIQPGDVVVGLASFGQTVYESAYNGGMGSNGLTSARHDVLHKDYAARFPESFDPNLPREVVYTGDRHLTDPYPVALHSAPSTLYTPPATAPVGKLLLSPTRSYLPVLKELLAALPSDDLHGLIHCTGGGQTKVLKFIQNAHVIKDNLFDLPPLFRLIQESSGTDWREMYSVFNMGHRMEIYVPERCAHTVIELAAKYNIDSRVIGRVVPATGQKVTVQTALGVFEYEEHA